LDGVVSGSAGIGAGPHPNLLDLNGRIALVTGAGQGIGREVALQFAAHGARAIVVNDFYEERAKVVAREIARTGTIAIPAAVDVTDLAAVRKMIATAESQVGAIDILVNNAGNAGPALSISDPRPFWETEPSDWSAWLGANLYGVLNCSHSVVRSMIARGYGRIVTVISDAGRVGEPHLVVYSAAKAGAAGFTRALAKAVGRHAITANCVALGAMRTPATEPIVADPELLARITRPYILRRLGEPKDAASMVLFLSSDASSWITGQTFPVNGGYSMAM
jgi:2-hydroxycyclohexanecarboxyl-CoA dehydrogenase